MRLSTHAGKLSLALVILTAIALLGGVANARDRQYRTIYTFQGGSDGWFPIGVPAVDNKGNLYGVTVDGGNYSLGTVCKLTAPQTRGGAWTKTVLYNFTDNDPGYPTSLAIDKDGALYGAGNGPNTRGFIFRVIPAANGDGAWKYSVLYTLTEATDGSAIQGNLVLDSQGNLYGATELGGDSSCLNGQSCGTVFELMRPTNKGGKWHFTVLHTFTGDPDGAQPFAGVTFDTAGNLYGTTYSGGTYDGGAVYRLSPPKKNARGWTETVIYSFEGTNNIIRPQGPVTFDSSGNLYGTTPTGGDLNCDGGFGCGVVFELAPPTEKDGAWAYTTLYAFQGGNDGIAPQGYMVFDPQGNLYSTTGEGGGGKSYSGIGFRLSPPLQQSGAWSETVLHRFIAPESGGPDEGLTWGKWGDLYGVTSLSGGTGCQGYGCGTVFELRP